MSMTQDGKIIRYGSSAHGRISAPIGASIQLYRGSCAVLAGNGDAVTQGYLKSAASTTQNDTVIGMIRGYAGGTHADSDPGVKGGSSDGSTYADIETGTFLFQSDTSGDALNETTAGATVYLHGENANGPIAAKTSGSNTRPVLGVQLPLDPTIPSGWVAVKLTTVGSP